MFPLLGASSNEALLRTAHWPDMMMSPCFVLFSPLFIQSMATPDARLTQRFQKTNDAQQIDIAAQSGAVQSISSSQGDACIDSAARSILDGLQVFCNEHSTEFVQWFGNRLANATSWQQLASRIGAPQANGLRAFCLGLSVRLVEHERLWIYIREIRAPAPLCACKQAEASSVKPKPTGRNAMCRVVHVEDKQHRSLAAHGVVVLSLNFVATCAFSFEPSPQAWLPQLCFEFGAGHESIKACGVALKDLRSGIVVFRLAKPAPSSIEPLFASGAADLCCDIPACLECPFTWVQFPNSNLTAESVARKFTRPVSLVHPGRFQPLDVPPQRTPATPLYWTSRGERDFGTLLPSAYDRGSVLVSDQPTPHFMGLFLGWLNCSFRKGVFVGVSAEEIWRSLSDLHNVIPEAWIVSVSDACKEIASSCQREFVPARGTTEKIFSTLGAARAPPSESTSLLVNGESEKLVRVVLWPETTDENCILKFSGAVVLVTSAFPSCLLRPLDAMPSQLLWVKCSPEEFALGCSRVLTPRRGFLRFFRSAD